QDERLLAIAPRGDPVGIATGRRLLPREDGADRDDARTIAAETAVRVQVDGDVHRVLEPALRHVRYVEHLHGGGAHARLERAVLIEVAPERHVLGAAVAARISRVAVRLLDAQDADELTVEPVRPEPDAVELLVDDAAVGREDRVDELREVDAEL